MIIDIHAHIMKGQEKKIPDFIKVLDEYNVDKAVVAALPPIWVEEQVAITEETKKSVWYRPGGGFVEAPNDFIAECAKFRDLFHQPLKWFCLRVKLQN
jgi:hypothetical protein